MQRLDHCDHPCGKSVFGREAKRRVEGGGRQMEDDLSWGGLFTRVISVQYRCISDTAG